MDYVPFIVLWVAPLLLVPIIAQDQGKDARWAFFWSFFFGLVGGLFALLLLDVDEEKTSLSKRKKNQKREKPEGSFNKNPKSVHEATRLSRKSKIGSPREDGTYEL